MWLSVQCNEIGQLYTMNALISLHTKLEVSWIFAYVGNFLSSMQMTPMHLAVESNRIEMMECLLDQGADINFQDDNEVILHTNAVGTLS